MKFHFAWFEIGAFGLLMVYVNNLKIKPYPKNTNVMRLHFLKIEIWTLTSEVLTFLSLILRIAFVTFHVHC